MKKLSLKKLNLEANDLLHRNQLKNVFGGDGGYGGGPRPTGTGCDTSTTCETGCASLWSDQQRRCDYCCWA